MDGLQIQKDAMAMQLFEQSIMQILRKNGMMQGNKTFGTVAEVINDKSLMVEMTQSNSTEMVRCSPNIDFYVGDRVLIEYINNNPHDRFVVALISGGVDVESGNQEDETDETDDETCYDYTFLPYEPVEIIRHEDSRQAYLFIYGYDNPETTWEQELIRNDKGQVEEIIHRYPKDITLIRTLLRNELDEVFKYE